MKTILFIFIFALANANTFEQSCEETQPSFKDLDVSVSSNTVTHGQLTDIQEQLLSSEFSYQLFAQQLQYLQLLKNYLDLQILSSVIFKKYQKIQANYTSCKQNLSQVIFSFQREEATGRGPGTVEVTSVQPPEQMAPAPTEIPLPSGIGAEEAVQNLRICNDRNSQLESERDSLRSQLDQCQNSRR